MFLFSLPVESVPPELRDPFYCDQYEQEHLKPPVTRLLQSSELYCRTYGLLLGGGGGEAQPKDNGALLQLLAERGVVPKDQGKAATDADLRHKPIKMVTLAKLLRSGLQCCQRNVPFVYRPEQRMCPPVEPDALLSRSLQGGSSVLGC